MARGRVTYPRRKRVWMRDFGTDVIVGTAPFARDLSSIWNVSVAPNIIGATIARVHISVAAARTAGASTLPHIFWGLRVGPTDLDAVDQDPALAGGMHQDWMFWRKSYLNEQAGGQAVAALGSNAWSFDVKAMRKLEEFSDTLWLVGGNSLADNYAISWGVSSLVLLP